MARVVTGHDHEVLSSPYSDIAETAAILLVEAGTYKQLDVIHDDPTQPIRRVTLVPKMKPGVEVTHVKMEA